jgi:transcriptional regulator with XRE-family HTH domain
MLDMSQTDVANALGLTFQQVQKYEKGSNRIGMRIPDAKLRQAIVGLTENCAAETV